MSLWLLGEAHSLVFWGAHSLRAVDAALEPEPEQNGKGRFTLFLEALRWAICHYGPRVTDIISRPAFGRGVKPCHRRLWVSALQTSQFPSSRGPMFVSMVMNESPTGSGHYWWQGGLFTDQKALKVEGEIEKGDNRRMGKRRESCRHTFSSIQQTHWRLGKKCNFLFFAVLLIVRLMLDHTTRHLTVCFPPA